MAAIDVASPVPGFPGAAGSGLNLRMQRLQKLEEAFGSAGRHFEIDLLIAAVLQLMTGSFDLVLVYLLWRRSLQPRRTTGPLEGIVTHLWEHLFEDDLFCMRCCLELMSRSSAVRMSADRFAMESILVERIMQNARRGVIMTLDRVIEDFLGLWCQRSHIPDFIAPWIAKLAYHRNTRRKFGVRLRQVWNLQMGSLRTVTPTEPISGQVKAYI